MLELRVEATRYEVTKYPAGSVNASHFTVWVERRDVDRWCVTDGVYCYRRGAHRGYESNPSSRTDRFKKAYRFPLEEALELAQRVASKMLLGGRTAEEVWEWEQQQSD